MIKVDVDWDKADMVELLRDICDVEKYAQVGTDPHGQPIFEWAVETAGAVCRLEPLTVLELAAQSSAGPDIAAVSHRLYTGSNLEVDERDRIANLHSDLTDALEIFDVQEKRVQTNLAGEATHLELILGSVR